MTDGEQGRPPRPTRWTFRYARLVQLRWLMAAGPLVALAGSATSLIMRGVTNPATQPAVVDLQVGGVLVAPVALAVAAVVLVASLMARRGIEAAYMLAAAVSVTYGVATGYSATIGGGWVTASQALGTAVTCAFFALVYWKGR